MSFLIDPPLLLLLALSLPRDSGRFLCPELGNEHNGSSRIDLSGGHRSGCIGGQASIAKEARPKEGITA